MRVITSIEEMRNLVKEIRGRGKTIGLVATMGYLHEGHLTIMREAKKAAEFVIISIFVNPLQFGVGEDYEEYPRDISRDAVFAEGVGVDVIFAPTVKEMYPSGYITFVEVEKITERLCGNSRPGHFRGVTTVVAKLFNIVQPDTAFFGQKDAQQVIVLQKMVEDLNMNLEIKVIPTVREEDGLALSSRNNYLSPKERQAALVLSKGLNQAKGLIESGNRDANFILGEIIKLINDEPMAKIDYVEILSIPDLNRMDVLAGGFLIAMAVFIGKTRLIDNMVGEV